MPRLTIARTGNAANASHRLTGGKHSFAHALAVAALADSGQLRGAQRTVDTEALLAALALVFEHVSLDSQGHVTFGGPRRPKVVVLPRELLARSRNLFCVLPALLQRAEHVVLEGDPTGCLIGDRPSDWYIDTLTQFGVEVQSSPNGIVLAWPARRPATIKFDYPTMTGTVVAVAAAALAPGKSRIRGASLEPSCDDQLDCLRSMSGWLSGVLPDIEIDGRAELAACDFDVRPDRVHAVTILTAALLTRGQVTVKAASPIRVPRFVDFLESAGVVVHDNGSEITAKFPTGQSGLKPVDIEAGSEPNFSSDWAPFAALLLATRALGRSTISDDVFLQRFQFIECFSDGGLDNVSISPTVRRRRRSITARINGTPNLTLPGGRVRDCADIRGSAALALSALVSHNAVVLADDFQLRRGYEDLGSDLQNLGIATTQVAT